MNNAIDIMSQTIQKQFFEDSQDNAWFGSKFDIVNYLKIDSSGKLGLSFITTICNMSNVDNEPKKYQEDGYTLIINNKKVVIKTARMDKNKKFQHESLSNDDKYDYILFVDISPQNLYLTILKKFDLSVKKKISLKNIFLVLNT